MNEQSRMRGIEFYARLMAMLKAEPRTSAALAADLSIQVNHLRQTFRRLHAHRLIYIHEWAGDSGFGVTPSAVWAVGREDDAPAPFVLSVGAPPKGRPLLDGFARAWHELDRGACSAIDLEQLSGLSRGSIYRLLRAMRDHGLVRIASWERRSKRRTSSDYMPCFKLGTGRDVPRPAPLTACEITRRYERRIREHRQRLTVALHTHPFDLMASQLTA